MDPSLGFFEKSPARRADRGNETPQAPPGDFFIMTTEETIAKVFFSEPDPMAETIELLFNCSTRSGFKAILEKYGSAALNAYYFDSVKFNISRRESALINSLAAVESGFL